MSRTNNPIGSTWNRWEPHIHAPGTVQNNQFGTSTLDDFCDAVTTCSQVIRALGVTDYLSINLYEELIGKKAAGKLPNVDLLFPNVELRFGVGTLQGSGVNAHLLFSPDDPNHVTEIKRFLNKLKFRYKNEEFTCSDAELIRLGRAHNPAVSTDKAALEEGTRQFKVSLDSLVDELKVNEWARKNMLIGVAASSKDGTSGVRTSDHAFDALRTSIESACHVIFSGSPKDVEFWLGRGPLSTSEIIKKYGGIKPCIHGSDAHSLEKVGKPDEDRCCWIKGDVTFETLRQVCLEPESRVHIGPEPPRGGLVGQTVTSLKVTNANWMVPTSLGLNPGLIAIIGARGSGKTALADFVAVGAFSMSAHVNSRSFIRRARAFLDQSSVTVKWESGEETTGSLLSFEDDENWELSRVQYLSQQFVDELCSAEGLTDKLLDEIKRVIYLSHPENEREGASDFAELYDIRCQSILEQRSKYESELGRLTDMLLQQLTIKQSIPEIQKKLAESEKLLAQDQLDRQRLVSKGQEERLARHGAVQKALLQKRGLWESAQRKVRALHGLQADLLDFRNRVAIAFVDQLKANRADSGLTDQEWLIFKPAIEPDADEIIRVATEATKKMAADLIGPAVSLPSQDNLAVPHIPATSALEDQTINLLQAESDRLAKLIGIDKQNSQRFATLSTKIQQTQKQVEQQKGQLEIAKKADVEISAIRTRRRAIYRSIFDSFVQLQHQLESLYAPLSVSLDAESGALGKLKFVVRRIVDIGEWVQIGEDLLDLRKDGPFKGRGALFQAASKELLAAWESGDPETADRSVDSFISRYGDDLKKHKLDTVAANEWGARIWQWLLSTSHIEVTYGLQYGNVDIERLSPGTRGIVLLLLYLAIDKEDSRPLIIDQPEENLDPQSVYDELVHRFREAKSRRQIIIVTHNANLVVNTDADQVIVASAGEHAPGELPEIKYESGGLENPFIRRRVCEILEGGEEAFRARAKRLRLSI